MSAIVRHAQIELFSRDHSINCKRHLNAARLWKGDAFKFTLVNGYVTHTSPSYDGCVASALFLREAAPDGSLLIKYDVGLQEGRYRSENLHPYTGRVRMLQFDLTIAQAA